jgi:hypothetical protein
MYLNNQGVLVIDDPFICDFISNHRSDEFLKSCETIIKNICLMYPTQNKEIDILASHFNIFKGELIKDISKQLIEKKPDFSEAVKYFDLVNQKNTQVIQHTLDNIISKIEKQDIKKTTNKSKGIIGEDLIFLSLQKILSSRDGYNISKTNSIPNSCDIKISRTSYNDIYIESKAYTDSVPTDRTKKFENDIIGLNAHGIFISLHSNICGRGQVEFDLMSTNKFAIYLSNTSSDMDIIKEYVLFIYKLDLLRNTENDFFISQNSIIEITRLLADFNIKINTLKTALNTSMSIVKELTTDNIERILLNNPIKNTNVMCILCNEIFNSKSNLSKHMVYCKKKNIKKQSEYEDLEDKTLYLNDDIQGI